MSAARYAIGIDLGTTNCVLAYTELGGRHAGAQALALPQAASTDSVVDLPLLPSCFYFVTPAEMARGQLDPFSGNAEAEPTGYFVGMLARDRLDDAPGRVIHSAKSWLAHGGIDREAQILPFASDDIADNLKLSPVEASAAYLQYLQQAWDHAFARGNAECAFARQKIVITVPASFDEGAQALTRKAAELAGYPADLRLLEEPQAAFYAWLAESATDGTARPAAARLLEALPALAQSEQSVLVVDMGGGTTDFSLFRIAPQSSARAEPQIERIAASDHLLLGGDNLDLALAHLAERALLGDSDTRLGRRQWQHLLPQARRLKERLLADEASAGGALHVSVPGAGANLFASALSAELDAASVRTALLDGFFPHTPAGQGPQRRAAGLREIGLPYAADSAVSRHLAGFLRGREIDAVLYAGGSLRPARLQQRLTDIIANWQGRRPAQLALADMSLAIALGAARYAQLAAQSKTRIRGGYARSVYLELAREAGAALPNLVCVLPQGFEEGGHLRLAAPSFDATLNRPVRFTAYTSNCRKQDAPGALVPLNETDFHALPPLFTTLLVDAGSSDLRAGAGQRASVQLEAELTELGVLQLALHSSEFARRWQLEFNLRKPQAAATPAPGAESAPQPAEMRGVNIAAATAAIEKFYGRKQAPDPRDNVKTLPRELERLLGQPREAWNLSLLRGLWPALYPGITRRSRSLAHETTWLYLAGLLLRPGYGADLDPWRMAQLWECMDLGLAHRKEKSALANWHMMWRRTAGGLSADQQERLFAAALPQLKAAGGNVEAVRLAGSLERVAPARKQELAEWLFGRVLKGHAARQPEFFWALARLCARVPLYAAADVVLPATAVEQWFRRAADMEWRKSGLEGLNAIFAAACRLTRDRAIDVQDDTRARVLEKLRREQARPEQIQVVADYCPVSDSERSEQFGEQLPAGLSLGT
ncbi:MAG: Hsp70 family protein [Rhodocyclaceae bacterium]|nr:Hsp70 family protein [Rhodocyclaceae bacterium]MBX3667512.1 Hsp70 family protein [Rhodocyclaceae bacterium]